MAKETVKNDLIKSMKERIASSGANKKEIMYFPADSKRRVRFLQELQDGYEFDFHRHWERGIDALCLQEIGKSCPYCEEEGIDEVRYAWSVFDYETKAVKVLLLKATGITPIPSFIEFNETYGSLTDRDYTIKKNGKGPGSTFTVIPGDVSQFRNKRVKPLSRKAMLEMFAKAYPVNAEDAVDDDGDDEDEAPRKKSSSKASKGKASASKAKQTKKKKEPTLQEKLEELDMEELKEIALAIGLTKKEIKGLDEEELIELLFEDYEEEDVQEAYDDFIAENEEGDEDEDEDDDEDDEYDDEDE